MRLDYFTLLSKSPLKLNICSVKSPLLREIDEITIQTYNNYLNILLLNIDLYYKTITENDNLYLSYYSPEEKELILRIKGEYEKMSDEEKSNIQTLSILVFDFKIMDTIEKALDFFLVEQIKYFPKEKSFFVFDDTKDDKGNLIPISQINESSYSIVVDLILQRNSVVKKATNEDEKKAKNETALKILRKLKKGQEELDKVKKVDKKMELGNIISSVAARNKNGLNILNIWDITIYQLYDQFNRVKINDSQDKTLTSVSVWGDKENQFNPNLWLENIYYN